jgi:hypothetical protein
MWIRMSRQTVTTKTVAVGVVCLGLVHGVLSDTEQVPMQTRWELEGKGCQ